MARTKTTRANSSDSPPSLPTKKQKKSSAPRSKPKKHPRPKVSKQSGPTPKVKGVVIKETIATSSKVKATLPKGKGKSNASPSPPSLDSDNDTRSWTDMDKQEAHYSSIINKVIASMLEEVLSSKGTPRPKQDLFQAISA